MFSGLSQTLPVICWTISTEFLGMKGESPSESAQTQMKKGWKTFFKACGVRYVGKGFNFQLHSPLWLILVPILATLSALLTDFGLSPILAASKKPKQVIQ